MTRRARYPLMAALFLVAGIVWWQGGIVALLPVELQYAHCQLLDRQYQAARDNPSALDRLWLTARARRVEAAYRRVLRRQPTHLGARVSYGNFLADAGREDEGFRQWEHALAADPNSAVTHNNLGQHYLDRGEIARGLDHLERAVKLDPGGAVYHFNWANAAFSYRRDSLAKYGWTPTELTDRSLAAFRRARDLAPADVTYSRAYAEMYYYTPQPDWTAAYDAWRFCLNQPLDNLTREHTCGRLARVCMHLGRFDEAREWIGQMQSAPTASLRQALERKRLALLASSTVPAEHPAMLLLRVKP